MQKLIIIFLIPLNVVMILNACGPKVLNMQGQSIDQNLAPYLTEFQREGQNNGVTVNAEHLTMSFSEYMPPSRIENCPNCQVIAYCQPTSVGPRVVFKGSLWNQWPNSVREFVAFHELAHCLLDAPHNNTMESAYDYETGNFARSVPSSIMNELIFDSFVYESNRDTYVKRLFGHANDVPLTLGGPSQFENIY